MVVVDVIVVVLVVVVLVDVEVVVVEVMVLVLVVVVLVTVEVLVVVVEVLVMVVVEVEVVDVEVVVVEVEVLVLVVVVVVNSYAPRMRCGALVERHLTRLGLDLLGHTAFRVALTTSSLPALLFRPPSIRDGRIIEVEDAPGATMAEHVIRQRLLHRDRVIFTALRGDAAILARAAQVATVPRHQGIAEGRNHMDASSVLAHLRLLLNGQSLVHRTKARVPCTSSLIATFA